MNSPAKKQPEPRYAGVWSAAPTPFDKNLAVEVDSVKRMVDHHHRLGVKGLFLAGTNGEGPWLPERELRTLVRTVVKSNRGRMKVAVQVTDNSAARIVDNIGRAADDGADLAVIAPPFFGMSYHSPRRPPAAWRPCISRRSAGALFLSGSMTAATTPPSSSPKECSSEFTASRTSRSSRTARSSPPTSSWPSRPGSGGPNCPCSAATNSTASSTSGPATMASCSAAGSSTAISPISSSGPWPRATRRLPRLIQQKMNRLMYAVYGGKKIKAWLSGEKYLLVRLGLFKTYKNFPDYPLTEREKAAIDKIIGREKAFLLPDPRRGR